MKFEFQTDGESNIILKYLENEPVVQVPEQIDGRNVSAIGKYAFEGKNELIELRLPKTVVSIGAHAFYNCRQLLRVSLSNRMVSTEDGAFKNCRSLRFFHIKVYDENIACLKNLLAELNQELMIELEYQNGDGSVTECHLLFPKYSFEYAENTPARIINQLTMGSGVHYRECMREHDVDFKKYDAAFSVAKVNDTIQTLLAIARARLQYPHELSNESKEEYRNYIQEHFMEIVKWYVKEDDLDGLEFLGELEFFERDNIDKVIQLAHHMEKLNCVSMLLEYKKRHFGMAKKTFDL